MWINIGSCRQLNAEAVSDLLHRKFTVKWSLGNCHMYNVHFKRTIVFRDMQCLALWVVHWVHCTNSMLNAYNVTDTKNNQSCVLWGHCCLHWLQPFCWEWSNLIEHIVDWCTVCQSHVIPSHNIGPCIGSLHDRLVWLYWSVNYEMINVDFCLSLYGNSFKCSNCANWIHQNQIRGTISRFMCQSNRNYVNRVCMLYMYTVLVSLTELVSRDQALTWRGYMLYDRRVNLEYKR